MEPIAALLSHQVKIDDVSPGTAELRQPNSYYQQILQHCECQPTPPRGHKAHEVAVLAVDVSDIIVMSSHALSLYAVPMSLLC
jgi:hypothetical protein